MGLPLRLLVGASLVFALFALWQARVEYINYSAVISTLPINNFDPNVVYEIASIATPTEKPVMGSVDERTPVKGERTSYHRTTATVVALPSSTPSATPRATATSAPVIPAAPTSVSSPTTAPTEESAPYFKVEPLNATWRDTVTVSWKLAPDTSHVMLAMHSPEVGSFPFLGNYDNWYELPPEGSQTISLPDYFGTGCQSPVLEWELTALQGSGMVPVEFNLASTISFADVPFSLSNVSLSPQPAPAYGSATVTWEGQGGERFSWYGNSHLDKFGVDTGKHWRELRLTGSSGTASWVLERHTPTTQYGYAYGVAGYPSICGTVDLQMTCPIDYWYDEPDLRTEESCPTTAPTPFPAAFQRFEHGVMVWDSDLKMIHVLFDDGTNYYLPDWWQGEAVTFAETPPAGYLLPQQGFGYLWVSFEEMRNKLGWATAPEQGYTMTRQQVKNRLGTYFSGYMISGPIYFSLPDGHVVRAIVGETFAGGGWATME